MPVHRNRVARRLQKIKNFSPSVKLLQSNTAINRKPNIREAQGSIDLRKKFEAKKSRNAEIFRKFKLGRQIEKTRKDNLISKQFRFFSPSRNRFVRFNIKKSNTTQEGIDLIQTQRPEEIAPRNIPKFSFGLNRFKGLFKF